MKCRVVISLNVIGTSPVIIMMMMIMNEIDYSEECYLTPCDVSSSCASSFMPHSSVKVKCFFKSVAFCYFDNFLFPSSC